MAFGGWILEVRPPPAEILSRYVYEAALNEAGIDSDPVLVRILDLPS